MKKLKVYLDTSLFNFLFEEKDEEKQKATELFFQQIHNAETFLPYVSALVLRELEHAPVEKLQKMMYALKGVNAGVLEESEEAIRLSNRYVEEGLIPPKYRNDAVHLALASVYEIDVVVSWNLEHMVKLKTKRGVSGINRLEGYREIEILTPQEVIESETA